MDPLPRLAAARWAPLALALGCALALAGCYTVLQHPRSGTELTESGPRSESCLRCHNDSPFDSGAVPWVEYYSYSSYPWINYYGSPWWYDSAWYWHGAEGCDDCPESEALPQLAGRGAWGRRPRGGWDEADTRERTSSALAPIAGPPPPAPTPAPPGVASSPSGDPPPTDPPEEPEEEPRQRSVRR